jgi:hypothetical protein
VAERDISAEGFKEIAFGAFICEWKKAGTAGSALSTKQQLR